MTKEKLIEAGFKMVTEPTETYNLRIKNGIIWVDYKEDKIISISISLDVDYPLILSGSDLFDDLHEEINLIEDKINMILKNKD